MTGSVAADTYPGISHSSFRTIWLQVLALTRWVGVLDCAPFIGAARKGLTAGEREFLLLLKAAKFRKNLMKLPGIEPLPANQRKLANIVMMAPPKRRTVRGQLQAVLVQ